MPKPFLKRVGSSFHPLDWIIFFVYLCFSATHPWLRVAHRCWVGQQATITLADLLHEVRTDPELSPGRKAQYEAIFANLPLI
jgi:hypothetical protein